MSLLKRHKYVLITLGFYWPAIFIATHVPIPLLARRSGMSDKTMHFLAYFILVFFWWFAISPYKKVHWAKAKVWISLVIMVWYGVFDEWLQGRVGRSADVMDFFADLTGTVTGLLILTVFTFWPAGLIFSTILIFTIANLSKIDLLWELPFVNTGFHFLSYAMFTLIWIQYIYRYLPLAANNLTQSKWLLVTLSVPILFLAAVKFSSIPLGKEVWLVDCVTAFVGIASAVLTSYFTCMVYTEEPEELSQ